MLTKVNSAAVRGIGAHLVQVEVDLANGIPSFTMTGYLGTHVREAGERVRTAIKNVGYVMPCARIVVNVAPASIRKNGTMFDLPVAIGILSNMGVIKEEQLNRVMLAGELSLDGHINGIRGVLSMVDEARKEGIEYCIIPYENLKETDIVDGIHIIGVCSLQEVIEILNSKELIGYEKNKKIQCNDLPVKIKNLDYTDVYGQYLAKRALVIAASGHHNIILSGPPGSGKTLLANRIPTILPHLSKEEVIEVSKIYSVAGKIHEKKGDMFLRPFRSPHHTITQAALIGGGNIPIPGEISLAHNGVLFLDELTKFRASVLENLRQPIENREISIMRNGEECCFPADIMLVAAMNPCACGFYPDRNRCNCSTYDILRHMGKLSQPFLDRFDMFVHVDRPEYQELAGDDETLRKNIMKGNNKHAIFSSSQMRLQVMKAHELQEMRYQGTGIKYNSQLTQQQMKQFCPMTVEASDLLKMYYDRKNLSVRGYGKIVKVARTIADLDNKNIIEKRHVSEAICFRGFDGMERVK